MSMKGRMESQDRADHKAALSTWLKLMTEGDQPPDPRIPTPTSLKAVSSVTGRRRKKTATCAMGSSSDCPMG